MHKITTDYYDKEDRSWTKILKPDELIDYVNPIDGYQLDKRSVDVCFKKLSFYEDLEIVRIYADRWAETPEEDLCFFFVRKGEELIMINGASDSIYAANELGGLILSKETCLEYLKFFCMFTTDEEEGNAFFILDSAESEFIKHLSQYEKDKFLKNYEGIQLEDVNGVFHAHARVLFGPDIFDSEFRITTDGFIDMVDDEHVCSV